tara:strand:+ start:595 stop:1467 length:873 start_codon:yes stop_codon:yes gene_type:complete
MDLHKLKIFKCVADMGGINISASELKMRQSSISTAISSLEAELGYKILQRHYRGMALTKMGKKFYEFAKKTLLEYEVFLASTEEVVGDVKIEGALTIATSFGLSASDWFVKKISTIMEKYPDLKIKVINYIEGDENISLADIIICPFISGRSDFLQNKMEDFSFKLFASKEYIDKFGLPQKYEDLDNHRLVSFSKILRNPFDEVDSLLHRGCHLNKLRNVCLEINNSIGLLKIIKEGYGIAALPVEEGLEEGLIPLFGSNDLITKTTCFTYSKSDKANINIKAIESIFMN